MLDEVDKEASKPQFGGRIHPLHLALDVQAAWMMAIGWSLMAETHIFGLK